MSEPSYPTQSSGTLLKATIVAVILAAIVFVTVVLPAEYNIDISGIGGKLGLTVLAEPVPVAPAQVSGETSQDGFQEDEVTIVIPAKKGLEYKFHLAQFAKFSYEWTASNNTPLYFDLHGEPDGDTSGYFESYALATTHTMSGSMTAPFEGAHGWYWRNRGDEEVTVTLKTSGVYQVIGLK
ncbi:MAG: hypothetical protein COC19_03705 [SAR86 cluster bacterium]|uniref:Transmembrane anchor protein n=1 Tax=SAR86 cluster bacterium TaxID=2030880 RepID=A0A2A4MNV2_9GAMM|nr:MAG: hypothetical protein COC19_03705 [SAR86 cluster bacterium]